MQHDLLQQHITEVIEESLIRRLKETIDDYILKNSDAFAQNKIAGVEWEPGLTVLVDNLGLNSQPKPSFFKRFLNAFKKTIRKI